MVTQSQEFRSTRTAGFWLAAAIAALQGVNAVRTVLDPQGFATYMGLDITVHHGWSASTSRAGIPPLRWASMS